MPCALWPYAAVQCTQYSPRIGCLSVTCLPQVRSAFHDGFDVQFNHGSCAISLGSSPDDFKGFQRLEWSDQVRAHLQAHDGQPFLAKYIVELFRDRPAP
eukprot:6209454-Pleurochrysis_carterae.AAC.4